MKKEFVEPEIRRIAINLKESIADGSGVNTVVTIEFRTIQGMAGCTDIITDTLPNPGALRGGPLADWIVSNAAALASCSVLGVQEAEASPRLFMAAAPTVGSGTVAYEVPKDIADAYGMRY